MTSGNCTVIHQACALLKYTFSMWIVLTNDAVCSYINIFHVADVSFICTAAVRLDLLRRTDLLSPDPVLFLGLSRAIGTGTKNGHPTAIGVPIFSFRFSP